MARVDDLVDYLRGSTSLDVVCHDDPDPDCIASAATLKWIAETSGVSTVRLLYGGRVSHQQNREMVRQFGLHLVPLSSVGSPSADCVAFVDHAIPGGHTELPAGTAVDVVIDHHQHDEPVYADFIDIRPYYGATSTIMVEYLTGVVDPPPINLASMLLFAIHRVRLDHVRNPTHHEYDAALFLNSHASQSLIDELYGAQFLPATVNAVGDAIRNREVRGRDLVSWVGRIEERDALPQAADYLVNLRGVEDVLVFGVVEDVVHLSARSQNPAIHLGQVLRDVVGRRGRAGGHGDMAGGTIPVDPQLARAADPAVLAAEVAEPIAERYFSAVASSRLSTGGRRRARL